MQCLVSGETDLGAWISKLRNSVFVCVWNMAIRNFAVGVCSLVFRSFGVCSLRFRSSVVLKLVFLRVWGAGVRNLCVWN